MKSRRTGAFLDRYAKLPVAVKAQARKAYRLWKENPSHPGLHFKRIHGTEPIYSARVSVGWRALGLLEGDTVTWF